MIQSLDNSTLANYISQQINNIFPESEIKPRVLYPFVKKAMARTEYCFSKIITKYFFDGKNTIFNHLNTDQYAMYLYYLSNTVWMEEKDHILASKIYYLNKVLNSLDTFYEVKLPDIFLVSHPVGTVLGRAKYSDYLVIYQRVTVGGNKKLEYPVLGKGIAMYGGSAVIGNCNIGDDCSISYGTVVMDRDIPKHMVVFGNHPDIMYKKANSGSVERFFI